MRLIIEARLDGDLPTSKPIQLGIIEREDEEMTPGTLGLSLAEGRALLHAAQEATVSAQVCASMAHQAICQYCNNALAHKDCRTIVCRTVFGKVRLSSPRYFQCWCRTPSWCPAARSFSPVAEALKQRMTSELEYLQVQWAAYLPYAVAAKLLKQVLPLDDSVSVAGLKNRVRAVGKAIDLQINQEIASLPVLVSPSQETDKLTAVAVDSVWLKHCDRTMRYARQVNVVG